VSRFKNGAAVDAAVGEHGDELAAILVEPVAANMGLVAPQPGFLAALRRRCDELGALLIVDEVITGFRVGPGGAQARIELTPDLSLFGKVLGGGLPLAGLGGPAALLGELAPDGPVYQAGTLAGNPLATAAGLAVLGHLDAAAYETLEAKAQRLERGLSDALAGSGLPAQVPRAWTLCGLFFAAEPVTDYDRAQAADGKRYARFFQAMLRRGVFLPPSPFETWFPSLAHTEADLDATVQAAAEAAAEVASSD
jgi:glutamate-1-semialdehyde 2,1-aminomutase